jgi:nicotinamidase-related amidase
LSAWRRACDRDAYKKEKTMALTTLDPKPALIVVDLQKGVVDAPTIHPAEEIVERSASLADAFRRRSLPAITGAVKEERRARGLPTTWPGG